MLDVLETIDPQVWAAILGAAVGFLFAELSAFIRRRADDRKQRDSVRAGLHYEIADNIAALEKFWPQVGPRSEDKNSANAVANRLMNTAVPVWSTVIWEGTAPMIAIALNATEITETQRLYATLAAILETQRRLESASNSDTANLAAQPETPSPIQGMSGHKFPTTHYLSKTAQTLAPELNDKVEAVLARGNPIQI